MSTSPQSPGATPLRAIVAEEVRALMGRRFVTQTQLADILQISQSQISKRLRGQIPFDSDEIATLAEFFNVHPAELFGGAPPLHIAAGPRAATTGRYRRLPVTLRKPPAMKRTPAQIAAAA